MATLETPAMKISHNIIEHLGLKLYQNKPTNVIAELVSNAWDANAQNLSIEIHSESDNNRFISIADDGCGMDIDTLSNNYLIIGKAKYNSLSEQKEIKEKNKRSPMGRKGIGKLAPFGICNKIHVITVQDSICNWLCFDYHEMIKIGKNSSVEDYHPEFIVFSEKLPLSNINFSEEYLLNKVKCFLNNISNSKKRSGTLILLTDLTLKRSISIDQLIKSIGQRFTVILGRPDFTIKVNGTVVNEENALPEWDLRIPAQGVTSVGIMVNGEQKTFNYWIGFVKEASWPTEHAGIGVYAHGKIAQDRPFFFNVEGREILSRYMYGVIEADLVEELEEDLISTDRTSINWDNNIFDDFLVKGKEITKNALDTYLKYRKDIEKNNNAERIRKISQETEYKLNSQEQSHLNELLNEITPKLGKNEERIKELTTLMTRSWLNEPSRRLVKKLWNDFEKENDLKQLESILIKLSDELVPQSLNLTRTFAQRVFALTKLKERIEEGKETPLQQLLEDFPWVLSHYYEKFTRRQSLITAIKTAEKKQILNTNRHIALDKGNTKPDFVFLGSATDEDILVIELKNNEPVGYSEFEQLRSYVEYFELTYTTSKVKGILIASDLDTKIEKKIRESSSLDFMSWDSLLKKSRREYITFLSALLLVSNENPQDAIDWGGKEVEEFLNEMAKNDVEIKQLMEKYKSNPSS